VPPARAEADHADLAVGVGLRTQELHGARDVAQHLLVGDAARSAHARADVIRTSWTFAEVEMRRNRRKSMVRELAGRLLDPFVPSGHVMDEHDAGPGAAERPRIVGFAEVTAVAAKRDRFREHAFIGHAVPHQLNGRCATIAHNRGVA
jgi:hypothetical protein